MPEVGEQSVIKAINNSALPLVGESQEYDALVDRMAEASFVLIGEASHGTHEFYRQRAEITKRLIKEKGFRGVALEADWPDAYRVHRYVTGSGRAAANAVDALGGFRRFPTWMWRNPVVKDFVEWLRDHNQSVKQDQPKAGFYGLDLYSLYSSIKSVLGYLRRWIRRPPRGLAFATRASIISARTPRHTGTPQGSNWTSRARRW